MNGAPKMRQNRKNKGIEAIPAVAYNECMEDWIELWHA